MIKYAINKIFGTRNERELKKLQYYVDKVNEKEPELLNISDEKLKEYTNIFRQRLKNGETLDDILIDAFAVVRETARRVLNMRHFDVQIIGGVVLHQGKIAEMKTGEGKTLVATLPAYLNALEGKGVHIVTVNDYLAKRDSEWMGNVYKFLGLTVGVIQNQMNEEQRKEAYNCDITYGTNNEFGFDYLRDNMKFEVNELVQREYSFAIVDEVDSILIDEARTPLIISGPTEESTSFYYQVNEFVVKIKKDNDFYELDEKSKTVVLTEKGIAEAEKYFKIENLFDLKNMDLLHQIYQSLKAHLIFKKDFDYIVKDGQVLIVDEFTGRIMPGRRYSDGLHQALEAKERVKIEQEYQTYATITLQNYFRMYDKLAGMTGTAITEAEEFMTIYGLDVIEIPTNKPLRRIEHPDVIYGTKKEKWNAVVNEIKEYNKRGQPVLVGTISIENSEILHRILTKERIKHVVLNAKYHEKEAEIVAQAGRVGAVTIATNMAGRGTDILLGGNPDFLIKEELKKKNYTPETAPEVIYTQIKEKIEKQVEEEHNKVIELGGLHILGTERHEARRIDNQLRGRSGRQGDPGSSRFYISLEDDLMKILGSDRIRNLLMRVGLKEGVPIESKLVSKTIENAQRQIESMNFSARKHLLEYDDVMNKQRKFIYEYRRSILEGKDFKEEIFEIIENIYEYLFDSYIYENKESDEWDFESLRKEIMAQFGLDIQEVIKEDYRDLAYYELKEKIKEALFQIYETKEKRISSENMRELERMILLQVIDSQWKDHLYNLDHLKEGIGLRGYAQKDPLIEYKKESFQLFEALRDRIEEEVVRFLYLFEPVDESEMEELKKKRKSSVSKPTHTIPSKRKKKNKKKKRR